MKRGYGFTIRRGFTLVELLVGILVSFILLGGLIITFNNINTGIKNANRSNDLTHATRGIFQMLKADFAVAGKGLSDLNTLQIHFANASASAIEDYFYGIVAQPKLNGSTQIVLQWFEYTSLENPTFT